MTTLGANDHIEFARKTTSICQSIIDGHVPNCDRNVNLSIGNDHNHDPNHDPNHDHDHDPNRKSAR